jgi:hypothetical protein
LTLDLAEPSHAHFIDGRLPNKIRSCTITFRRAGRTNSCHAVNKATRGAVWRPMATEIAVPLLDRIASTTLRYPAPRRDHIPSQTYTNEPARNRTRWTEGVDGSASVRTRPHRLLPVRSAGPQSCTRHHSSETVDSTRVLDASVRKITIQSQTNRYSSDVSDPSRTKPYGLEVTEYVSRWQRE